MSHIYDLVKCTIIGDCNVGKTRIINKFFNISNKNNNKENDYTNDDKNCTIGAIYWSLSKIRNNKKIKINLWDTAGQEKFNSLIPMYTRGCDILLLTFDLTDKKTFYNLIKWYNLCKSNLNIKYIIVGNKNDRKDFIQVTEEMINDFISLNFKNDIPFILTSAKTGENIDELFDIIFLSGEGVINRRKIFYKPTNNYISLNNESKTEKKYCCY